MSDKDEATRLADELTKPSEWLSYYGVQWHPQPHVVDEAAALLRRWPDGEPVAWISAESLRRLSRGGNDSRGTVPVHATQSMSGHKPLYAAPLDQSERIAALEAALAERDRVIEQARVALERIRHATAPTHDDGGHHEAAHDLSIDALRAIEEVRRG